MKIRRSIWTSNQRTVSCGKFVPTTLLRPRKSLGGEYTWLSRSFAQDDSQTEGPTARTPKYCAPEVYNFDPEAGQQTFFR